ncbi:mitogen-activated protein kinase [Plakobranchus ocellatus]|uniref:Mitogen-activated protein kinase n=1 Tax=Plakobranchus ocellatus TaxID=259542 RepID=A0AAV4DGA0_9GAST|nr:mitogen-activated protein kinase [Plakobranchus ocellatus]
MNVASGSQGPRTPTNRPLLVVSGWSKLGHFRVKLGPRAVTDPRDNKRVALKKMSNVFQNVVSAIRVYRELRMLCHFRHENEPPSAIMSGHLHFLHADSVRGFSTSPCCQLMASEYDSSPLLRFKCPKGCILLLHVQINTVETFRGSPFLSVSQTCAVASVGGIDLFATDLKIKC